MADDIAAAYTNALADLIAARVAARLEQSIGDDILTVEQAAALLKIHRNTVTQYARDGHIPAVRLGDSWRFRRSALLNHVTATDKAGTR